MKTVHRPIRVAYVIDKLALHGSQKTLIYLVQCLSQRNYQQRVYCLKDDVHPDNQNRLLKCGAEVSVIGKSRFLMMIGLVNIVSDWLIWKPDIVFTMLFYSDIIGRIIAKITAVPIIISSIRSSIRARNNNKSKFQLYLDRLTVRWADKVVFNNQEVIPFAIKYEEIHVEQIVHIPNGVDTSLDPIEPMKKRRELGISKDTLLIGSVGRLHHDKGCIHLLRAFQLVRKQVDDCVLLFIGTGALLDPLTSLAKNLGVSEKTLFLGERTDVYELLACLNVYVQASVWEGMSNALMEAMALGKAVVATAVGGTLELIEDGETGWLVEPENADMLAEKICYVLKHPAMAAKIGAVAAERMAKEFSVEKMANAYDAMLRGLVVEKLRQQL